MDGFGEEEGGINTGVEGWMDLLLPSVLHFKVQEDRGLKAEGRDDRNDLGVV